jgi:hypothetical protein
LGYTGEFFFDKTEGKQKPFLHVMRKGFLFSPGFFVQVWAKIFRVRIQQHIRLVIGILFVGLMVFISMCIKKGLSCEKPCA